MLLRAKIKDLIREAEKKASVDVKISPPSDMDFFGYLKEYVDKEKPELTTGVEEDEEDDYDLDEDYVGSSIAKVIREQVWPKQTKSALRKEGAHAFTPLLGARKYVKEKSEFDYKIFDKAWRFFELRHQNFVDSLPENIKVIYDNFGQNPLLEKKYEARWGFQRTNLVVDVICRALYSEAETALGTLENDFYNMKQLDKEAARQPDGTFLRPRA